MSTDYTQGLEDDLESLDLKIDQREGNIKSLEAQDKILYKAINDNRAILKEYLSAPPSAEDNGGEEDLPANYFVVDNWVMELKGRRERLKEDLQREQRILYQLHGVRLGNNPMTPG